METSWAPVHRKVAGDVATAQVFNDFFNALSASDAPSLPANVIIPDTVVYTGGAWSWFSFDSNENRVVKEPPVQTTTDRIERFFCTPLAMLASEIDPTVEPRQREERNVETNEEDIAARLQDVTAVWISDKSDGKTTYTTFEYYSARDVQSFLKKNPLRRCGVLQRYLRCKAHPSQMGNEELLVRCGIAQTVSEVSFASSPDAISYYLESWSNRSSGLPSHLGLTPWHLVFPVQPTLGRVAAVQPPLSSQTTEVIRATGMDAASVEVHAVASELGAATFVALAFAVQRTSSFAPQEGASSKQQDSFTLWLKETEDNRIALLGLVSAHLPLLRMRFEVLPEPTVPKLQRQAKDLNLSGSLSMQSSMRNRVEKVASPKPEPRPLPKPAAAPNITTSKISPPRRLSPSLIPVSHGCPNCGIISDDGYVPVPYREILRYANDEAQKSRKQMENLIPPSRPASAKKGRDGRTILLPGPKAPRYASDIDAVKSLSPDAVCFTLDHKWIELPPILRRLTVDPFDLAKRSVWLNRCAHVCRGCRAIFIGSAADEATAPPESTILKPSLWRPLSARNRGEAEPPPPSLGSDVIDAMVVTDLQREHRRSRRTEREKFEMRQVVEDCRSGDSDVAKEIAEEQAARRLLEDFVCPVSTVTTSDVPFSVMLANELYSAMTAVTSIAPEPELGAVVSRPPRAHANNTAWHLPKPIMLVDTTSTSHADGVPEHHDRLYTRGRQRTFRWLDRHSFTFSQLSNAEKLVIVDFVGKDKHRGVLDDFKGPELDEDH